LNILFPTLSNMLKPSHGALKFLIDVFLNLQEQHRISMLHFLEISFEVLRFQAIDIFYMWFAVRICLICFLYCISYDLPVLIPC
jgi:hypothetical protein